MNTLSFSGEGNVLSFTKSGDDLIIKDTNGITVSTLTDIFKDLNTQLTTEEIQDVVGAMVTSNTETNISVNYDDTGGKLNFVATDTNTEYSIGDGGLSEINFTSADHSKLDDLGTYFYDVKFCNFQGSSTHEFFFIPWTTTSEAGGSSSASATGVSERTQFIAAYDGEIVKFGFRCEEATSQIKVKLLEAGPGQEVVTLTDQQIGAELVATGFLNDDFTAFLYPTNWVLNDGRSYGIHLELSHPPRDSQVVVVFKYTL